MVHRVSVLAVMAAILMVFGSWGWQGRAQAAQDEEKKKSGEPGDVTLSIGGDEGTRFAGTCSVGKEEHDIGGRVPQSFEYDLRDRKLACEIRYDQSTQSGRFEVVLRGENTRFVQRVEGGGESMIGFTYDDGNVSSSLSSSSSSQKVSSNVIGSSGSSTAKDDGQEGGDGQGSLGARIRKQVDNIIEQAMP